MSKIEVDTVEPQSGTSLTLGASGDTITIPSGATLDASNATLTLPDGSVTTAKIVDANVTLAKLSATGTKDATTFLRGDNTFAVPTDNGKVLQVVTATDSTARSTTSASYVTASNTLSISITPSSASSKIFLIFNGAFYSSNEGLYTFFRDSTNLATNANACFAFFKGVSYGSLDTLQMGMSFLDSPSSTSALTYQVYLRRGASGTAYINNDSNSVITAFEIAG